MKWIAIDINFPKGVRNIFPSVFNLFTLLLVIYGSTLFHKLSLYLGILRHIMPSGSMENKPSSSGSGIQVRNSELLKKPCSSSPASLNSRSAISGWSSCHSTNDQASSSYSNAANVSPLASFPIPTYTYPCTTKRAPRQHKGALTRSGVRLFIQSVSTNYQTCVAW